MTKEDFNFQSRDNLTLYGCKWETESPVAIICMVHGLGEHINRYKHVADAFNEKQISYWGFDLRGHGQSEGKKGHTTSIEDMFNDIEQFLVVIRKKYPDIPIIIYGHSLGGNLALSFLLNRNSNEISYGIITSPWLRLTNPPEGFQLMLAKFGSRFLPALAQPNGLDIKDISSVKQEQDKYNNDPLVHNKITGRLFMEINNMGEKAISLANTLKTPVLLAHGTEDNITSYKATESFARNAPSEMVKLKIWDDLRHETHNELNKVEVVNYYVDWAIEKIN